MTVEASSPVLIEKVRSAVTDAPGLYRIVDLLPGTYAVAFTLPGFTTVRREGVELTGSFAATIPALKVGGLEETITVTGASPVVDVQNTLRQTVLNTDLIETLPATRAYGSLLNAMPGLTVDNNGQAATPTMTFFTAHGGRINEGRSADQRHDRRRPRSTAAASSSLTYDTNNVEEISVVVSGGLGETETGGPSMNIVPRSGGNTFRGQAFFNTAGNGRAATTSTTRCARMGIAKAGASSTRTMRAGRSAGRSSATGCGSTAATGSFRPRSASKGTALNAYACDFRTGTTGGTTSSRCATCRAATSGQGR